MIKSDQVSQEGYSTRIVRDTRFSLCSVYSVLEANAESCIFMPLEQLNIGETK